MVAGVATGFFKAGPTFAASCLGPIQVKTKALVFNFFVSTTLGIVS